MSKERKRCDFCPRVATKTWTNPKGETISLCNRCQEDFGVKKAEMITLEEEK